jgi:hypothetical protein
VKEIRLVLLFKQGGMANASIMDLMIAANNGIEFRMRQPDRISAGYFSPLKRK